MSYGNVEESSKVSLDERQAMNRGKEELLAEQASRRAEIAESDVAGELNSVVHDMSLYKAFKGEMGDISGAVTEADTYFEGLYDFAHPFDDTAELQDLKDDVQRVANKARGTSLEGVANATLRTVDRVAPSVVAELVQMAGDYDSMTL